MSTVSYDRVVDVKVNISDRFPSVANFSIPILMTEDVATTAIGTDVVKSFGSLEEMITYGFADTDPVYQAAQAMLATPSAPRTFKVGLLDRANMLASLTAVYMVDSAWYTAVLVPTMLAADAPALIAANAFLLENSKILFFDAQDDALRDDGTDAASLGALLRTLTPSHLAGFYSPTVNETVVAPDLPNWYAVKAASYVSAVNYNNPNTHYTLKFKELVGAQPSNLSDLQSQNLTGFLPSTGLDPNIGGHLNAYICTAGLNFVVEGTMTDGQFIDLVTFSHWLVATMQQNVLQVYTNNRVVPYDLTGVAMLYSAIAQTLQTGVLSGALTTDRPNGAGDLLPAFEIAVQDIADVNAALVAQRISPVFEYCARYKGAFHYTDITGKLLVAN